VLRWARGLLPIAAALGALMFVFTVIAVTSLAGVTWSDRSGPGYGPVHTLFGTGGLSPGTLSALTVGAAAQTLITFIPEMPSTPPEIAYMHCERTNIPALVVNESAAGRVAYLAADIDRRYAIDNLPDHGNLLGNIIRWAAGDSLPVQVDGPGLVNCELYHQPGRLILHVVNLTSAGTWRAPMEELIPIGPLYVKVKIDREAGIKSGRALVAEAGGPISVAVDGGWASFELKSVLDHEVVVLE